MKIGTAGPAIDSDDFSRRMKSRFSGGGSDSGDGRNGGGNDDHGDDMILQRPMDRDKAKVITWFLLLVVLMTFGGMIGAYIVIATNGAAEWHPFDLPIQTWISTGLIIASSVVYEMAKREIFAGRYERSKKLLIGTTVLGAAFISSQILVWLALVNRGFYMRGNPYAGFFYILTAVHAIHVLGGVIALGSILLRSWVPTDDEREIRYRRSLARSVGWYWHFLGVLWIVLFFLLGFWK